MDLKRSESPEIVLLSETPSPRKVQAVQPKPEDCTVTKKALRNSAQNTAGPNREVLQELLSAKSADLLGKETKLLTEKKVNEELRRKNDALETRCAEQQMTIQRMKREMQRMREQRQSPDFLATPRAKEEISSDMKNRFISSTPATPPAQKSEQRGSSISGSGIGSPSHHLHDSPNFDADRFAGDVSPELEYGESQRVSTRNIEDFPRDSSVRSVRAKVEEDDGYVQLASRAPSVAPLAPGSREVPDGNKTDLEEEKIEVKVKLENGEEVFQMVSFTKSEDGMLDIWNLGGFNLGPPIPVHKDSYNRGFSREVISKAFGGGWVACSHNWQGRAATREPFVTFSREWNSELPTAPGLHGVVFTSFDVFDDDSPIVNPLAFFVRENANDWRYYGDYSVKRWGEISPRHINLLPPSVIKKWIVGALNSDWGRKWVDRANNALREDAEEAGELFEMIEYSENGLRDALADGTLTIHFTIMKCMAYRSEWFKRLLRKEDDVRRLQPDVKPGKKSSKRKSARGTGKSANKRHKGHQGRQVSQVKKEDPSSEEEIDYDQLDGSDEDYSP